MNKPAVFLTALAGAVVVLMTSCGRDPNDPGVEFMPDMYRSPSLEYYGSHVINGDTINSSKLPVAGTVARGYMSYV